MTNTNGRKQGRGITPRGTLTAIATAIIYGKCDHHQIKLCCDSKSQFWLLRERDKGGTIHCPLTPRQAVRTFLQFIKSGEVVSHDLSPLIDSRCIRARDALFETSFSNEFTDQIIQRAVSKRVTVKQAMDALLRKQMNLEARGCK